MNEGGLRGPVAELIERVVTFGFPIPGFNTYAAAIDKECAKLIAKFPDYIEPDEDHHELGGEA